MELLKETEESNIGSFTVKSRLQKRDKKEGF